MTTALRFGPPPTSTFDVTPSEDEIAAYKEQGFLVVERLTTDEELAWLTKIFDAVFEDEAFVFEPGLEPDQEGPPQLQQTIGPELRFPELLGTTYHRNAKTYASALMGVPAERLTTWGHMIRKPALKSRPAPWHQDEAYWEPELDYDAIAAWLPLHDVSIERGCMQFIPGSHLGDVHVHRHVGDPKANLLLAEDVDDSTAVPCPLKAGGATFHHPRTLHYTAPNTTGLPRLAYPIEWQVRPTWRSDVADRPWVYAHREAAGGGAPQFFISDGRIEPLGSPTGGDAA
jgi:ectoine hydroxylase-related dioxygenase (phytanoyl-CoA dioxygenase family)